MSSGKKKKTTRKIGYADDAGSTEDPFGPDVESVHSDDDSEDWTDDGIRGNEEDEDSSDTCNSV